MNCHLNGSLFLSDFDIKWPTKPIVPGQDKPQETSCLMHHKFILIDAEPLAKSESESADEEEENRVPCAKCGACPGGEVSSMASESVDGGSASADAVPCFECRPVRIRSKKDLVQFNCDKLPRLPKNGILITGSHNWSVQVRGEGGGEVDALLTDSHFICLFPGVPRELREHPDNLQSTPHNGLLGRV